MISLLSHYGKQCQKVLSIYKIYMGIYPYFISLKKKRKEKKVIYIYNLCLLKYVYHAHLSGVINFSGSPILYIPTFVTKKEKLIITANSGFWITFILFHSCWNSIELPPNVSGLLEKYLKGALT